jgi:hypothetical protein
MHRYRPWLASLALVATLAACNKPAATDGATPAADASAATASTPDRQPQATDTAASGFVLDMAKVDAYYATIGKIGEMAKADPSLDDADGDGESDDPIAMDGSETVEAYIARMEADPRAKRLVTSAGMSVPDFANTSAALLEGLMTAGMMEATGKKAIPEGINPQYVEFAQQHKAEIEAKGKALEAQYGGE